MKRRINNAKNTIKDFFENFYRVLRRRDMVLLPGTLSFFFVLAIIPTLGLISYGASILNLSTDLLYDFIAGSFSTEMADLILGVSLDNIVGIQFFITVLIPCSFISFVVNNVTPDSFILGISHGSISLAPIITVFSGL